VEDAIMFLAIKKILVPTDFSPNSQGALNYAEALALRFGAALHLVHVCEPVRLAPAVVDGAFISLPDVEGEMRTAATAQMSKLTQHLSAGIVMTTEITFGGPAAGIVSAADTHDADLIVMGTHGRGPLLHLVLGNVAERVVRTARCPVLTVREPHSAVSVATSQTLAHAITSAWR
jgi:nucleotide-binding universal stress UspA family protein